MLRRVKAEAVNAAVDALFKQTERPLLNVGIAGVEVGHAEVVLCDVVAVVVVGAGI